MHERSGVWVTMVQLPAMNTPQFDWLLSRLPKPARPVPPIYQPELAARAIVHAADHPRRREYWVGGSTVLTLLGNKLAPAVLDRYLARTGYARQQVDREPPDDPPNLWRPVDDRPGSDHGARTDRSTRWPTRTACRCGPRSTTACSGRSPRRWPPGLPR